MTIEEMKQLEFQKLYIRNKYSKDSKINFKDYDSELIFEKLENKDFSIDQAFEKKYMASLLTYDEIISDFIVYNSNAAIISIGNGLDSRKTRIKRENTKWYYVGNEELNNTYNQYRDECFINKDPFDLSWVDEIPRDAPTYLIVLEDFTMYYDKEKVLNFMKEVSSKFENLTFAVEIISKKNLKNNNKYISFFTRKELEKIDEDLLFVKYKTTYRGEEKLKWYKIFTEGFLSPNYSKVYLLHRY